MTDFFEDNESREGLSGQAVRGGLISIVARLANGILQFGTTMVLARLVIPDDFGLVAIVAAVSSFAPSLIELGLTDATVQRRKITPSSVSALFWLCVSIGCAIGLLLFLGSPYLAAMYGQPVLEGIAAATSITFVLYSLSVQHLALLRRSMRFKQIAVIEIIAYVAGAAVAIGIAVGGAGYWALVARPIVTSLFTVGGAWLCCDWRPGLPRFDAEARSMVKFGLHVTGFTLAHFVSRASDRVLLGFMVAPRLIGFYQNALLIYENAILAVIAPSAKVGVSALSKLHGDPDVLREKYLAALSTVSFFCMPCFATLSVLGPDLVPFLLGESWRPGGIILSILAVRGVFHVIESSQAWLHLSLGHPDRWMKYGVLSTIVHLIGVGAGLPYGVNGVATGLVVARCLLAIPAVVYAGRSIGIGFLTVLNATGRQLMGAAVVWLGANAALMLLPDDTGRFARLVIGAAVCGAIYSILVVGVFGLRTPLRVGYSSLQRHRH